MDLGLPVLFPAGRWQARPAARPGCRAGPEPWVLARLSVLSDFALRGTRSPLRVRLRLKPLLFTACERGRCNA